MAENKDRTYYELLKRYFNLNKEVSLLQISRDKAFVEVALKKTNVDKDKINNYKTLLKKINQALEDKRFVADFGMDNEAKLYLTYNSEILQGYREMYDKIEQIRLKSKNITKKSASEKLRTEKYAQSYEYLKEIYFKNLDDYISSSNILARSLGASSFFEIDERFYGVSSKDRKEILNTVQSSKYLVDEYFSIKAKSNDINAVHLWEEQLPLVKGINYVFNFHESIKLIGHFFSIFPLEIREIVEYIFKNNLVNSRKEGYNFATTAPDSEGGIYIRWDNSFNSVMALVHEIGHLINNKITKISLMKDTIKSEIVSNFFEYSFLNWLTVNEKYKYIAINYTIEKIRMTIFVQSKFTYFEDNIYQRNIQGLVSSSKIFTKIYIDAEKKFYNMHSADYIYQVAGWARIPHFYYGLYNYKYIYASIYGFELSSMFTCENNATDDTLESLKMKTFSDIKIYMNNSTEKNEKEMMKDLLVHFKVCLDMIKQK